MSFQKGVALNCYNPMFLFYDTGFLITNNDHDPVPTCYKSLSNVITANHSGAPEFTLGFSGARVARSFLCNVL